MEEIYRCYNKGCGQDFKMKDNSENACTYHPGGPIFHDALKGWSCCKKRVSDFTEFLNLKGCTIGWHSNVKPKESEKVEKKVSSKNEPQYQLEITPEHRKPDPTPAERPPDDEEMVELKKTIGASLKTQLEKLNLNDTVAATSANVSDGSVAIGTCCHNKGCKTSYEGPQSNEDTCIYHPGSPVFHEGMKYWTCCQRKTSDFDAFLNQEGCETGRHNWQKPKVAEEKKVRTDWHQTSSIVCVSIFAKTALPEQTTVRANRVKCEVSIKYEGGESSYQKTFILRQAINPATSQVKLLGTKVEINLKKAEAFSWPTLELPEES
ncbi:cysteine and histidine-rich domain-containing protein 1 [Plakobranchus ocellatus]|uniref:Cysteine and histidine-rich domain-containing protein 1 n=1 Tax=Plakobranchus ocellatus TaxID=259542 RepID=A0AAV4DG26_9GAST|nr:cysteine and histidine-rich domain-containing protein 1 [Plakobranchus ocellatus]